MEFISQFAYPDVDTDELLKRVECKGPNLRNSIQGLFIRPYWGRIWILQELASGRNVQVRCGHYSAPLEAFQIFIATVNSRLGTIAN